MISFSIHQFKMIYLRCTPVSVKGILTMESAISVALKYKNSLFCSFIFYYVRLQIIVGSAASNSCIGDVGIPQNVRTNVVSETTIQFTWEKPRCDETYGPIDGYEYTVTSNSFPQYSHWTI